MYMYGVQSQVKLRLGTLAVESLMPMTEPEDGHIACCLRDFVISTMWKCNCAISVGMIDQDQDQDQDDYRHLRQMTRRPDHPTHRVSSDGSSGPVCAWPYWEGGSCLGASVVIIHEIDVTGAFVLIDVTGAFVFVIQKYSAPKSFCNITQYPQVPRSIFP